MALGPIRGIEMPLVSRTTWREGVHGQGVGTQKAGQGPQYRVPGGGAGHQEFGMQGCRDVGMGLLRSFSGDTYLCRGAGLQRGYLGNSRTELCGPHTSGREPASEVWTELGKQSPWPLEQNVSCKGEADGVWAV